MTKLLIHTYDDYGAAICKVPLGQSGQKGHATIYEADLQALQFLGCSLNWTLTPSGIVTFSQSKAPGNKLTVARVLLDLGSGLGVRYVNGDPTDLRRPNLSVVADKRAKHRDRDYLTPWIKKRRRQRPEHIFVI